jgi:pSer/pThr/pTyr-binding forkhead associated (FHA) protein
MQDKQSLIKSITPLALLKAVTPEAKAAINKSCLGEELIGIWSFPFRIGRESRVHVVEGELVISERHRPGKESLPNNDVYLLDGGKQLHISREHLSIEKTAEGYRVSDRESACGTTVNTDTVGGEESGGAHPLSDGDRIRLGGMNSPFVFEFIVL